MKKILLGLMLVAGCLTVSAQTTEFSKKTLNEKFENFEGKNLKFSNIIKKHKGKTVVLEVWASWCGDCVKSMPKMKDLQAKHPETDFVFISLDKTTEKWKAGVEKHQIKGDHVWLNQNMKGSFGESINLDWIPRYIVLDKKGKILLYRAIETDFEKINTILNSQK